jgi:5'-methylthioadenosine phosphorylase
LQSQRAQIGIIGGTGLGDTLRDQAGGKPVRVETPYGLPSISPILANWEGVDVAFISRHGDGHRLIPSAVPYRANIWALKQLGVTAIIASGATGSLREDIEPGHLVICDQVIDKTTRRVGTFFDEGVAAHVVFADPFCANLRSLLIKAGDEVDAHVHHTGTYVCMEGPQFSTRAESHMHRAWGGDLIGMTCMPEAKLAREAEICYGLVALPTDYDCWRAVDPSVAADDLLAEIMGNLQRASENALALIRRVLPMVADLSDECPCRNALERAVWTSGEKIDPTIRKRLEPLIGRYLADNTEDDAT